MKRKIFNKLILAVALLLSVKLTAQNVTISLRANYSSEVNIYHDEPLLFTVSLTNETAQENSRWNKAADRRITELDDLLKAGKIKQEDYDTEKSKLVAGKRNISSVTVGVAGKPWSSMVKWKIINTASGTELVLNLRTMMNPSTEQIAVLNEKGYYTAYFGLDADEVRKIPAGNYRITASIEDETSEPVKTMIKNESMPATIANGDEMLLKAGQYYWHAGDASQGMKYADKLLQKNPNSIDGFSLRGDLHLLNNAYVPALESYNKALKEYYRQNGNGAEPPEYLLAMIEWVKKQ